MTESNGTKRDARGRFAKGTSGNPKGRPKKDNTRVLMDIGRLARREIEVNIGGERTRLTRQEATLMKLFEAAAKGNIPAAIYLDKRFQKYEEQIAGFNLQLQQLVNKWITDRPGQPVPDDVMERISNLRQCLKFEMTIDK